MQQSDFAEIFISFTLSLLSGFILFFSAIRDRGLLYPLIVLAILVRVILLFGMPCLSDDIYRFFWDGLLMHYDIHPLSYTPTELINDPRLIETDFHLLYPLLNSQAYYTIYPPISQLVFYLSTIPEVFDLYKSTLIMKAILLVSECSLLYYLIKLLSKLNINKSNVLIYALNPLVIIEVMSNVHYEGMMILFLIMSLVFIIENRMILAALTLATSIATKLLPLMFLPILLLYIYRKGKKLFLFLSTFTLFIALFFVPFFIGLDVPHFIESLDLYFRKFEFNASFYYVARAIGQAVTGYNQISLIGPWLSLLSLGLILFFSWKDYRRNGNVVDLITSMSAIFITYLMFATTVHPWYLILPLALNVFCRRIWLIVWSLMIVLSYSTYADPDFDQNLILISMEYIVVMIVWYIERKTRIKLN